MLKLQEENIDLIELLVGVCCIKNNAASTRAILIHLRKRKERFSRYICLTYKALKQITGSLQIYELLQDIMEIE